MRHKINVMKDQYIIFNSRSLSFHTEKKGQSEFLSHSLTVAISIFMIFILVTTMNTIKNDYDDFSSKSQVKQICNIIKSSVEKIYWPENYNANNTLLGSFTVNIPEKAAAKNYKISFSNITINVTTSDGISSNCTPGFDIIYNGTSTGGLTKINWYKINNTDVITLSEL